MFQQLLVNKHHRLRDLVPITIWPSGGLGLVTDKKKKTKQNNKSHAEQEMRSAHGRAVNKTGMFCFRKSVFGLSRNSSGVAPKHSLTYQVVFIGACGF